MSKLLVIAAESDASAAADLVDLVRASLRTCEVRCPTLESHDVDVERQLLTCRGALALVTQTALEEAAVPFLLGGAAALEKPVFAVVAPGVAPELLRWPMPSPQVLELDDPASIPLLLSRLSQTLEVPLHSDRPEAPPGLDATRLPHAENSMAPRGTPMHSDVAPAPDANQTPPGCETSLVAGRAFADALFRGETGLQQPERLDRPFGHFINALGGNWSSLRGIADVDLWMEMTDNVLEALPPSHQHLRQWYEIGFQLGTLVNLSDIPGDDGGAADNNWRERAELDETWGDAMTALLEAAAQAGLTTGQVATVEGMLENLRSISTQRSDDHVAQVERVLHDQAHRADNGAATPDLAT